MELHSTTMATRYQGIRVLLCNVVDITARKALGANAGNRTPNG